MDQQQLLRMFPDMEYDEIVTVMNLTNTMTEQQQQSFLAIYQGKRRDTTLMLVLTLIGFVGVAGIQRFIIGDIGLGILYFFTGGLCLIGTIIDLINYKKLTSTYNQKMAIEAASLTTTIFR
ncbi:MAG TPA: TM2 domain-containing protein [Niabella sp.]|nr:TM2 domain-containing protein [Niabella sp.]HQW14905.1 TM2 domain-containing protein [Niabella sp.]HQX18470.1 TM2 domain-containing protein [Niabella sp.]HQX41468.1 TM2 domain-containing protein [Niabella sp.]HRB05997.1 TM2 domain-containing protein [Niabella sp.]